MKRMLFLSFFSVLLISASSVYAHEFRESDKDLDCNLYVNADCLGFNGRERVDCVKCNGVATVSGAMPLADNDEGSLKP